MHKDVRFLQQLEYNATGVLIHRRMLVQTRTSADAPWVDSRADDLPVVYEIANTQQLELPFEDGPRN